MKKRIQSATWAKRLGLAAFGLTVLSACAMASPTPVESATNVTGTAQTATQAIAKTETETPTSTLRPTETSTPLMSPTSTSLLPTPALPHSNSTEFQFSEFFFDSSGYPDCSLPCWKGLTIGESGAEQVQNMFDSEFGFNGMLNFRTDSDLGSFGRSLLGFDQISQTYPMGFNWSNEPSDEFYISAVMDQDSDLLEGFIFMWTADHTSIVEVRMTPQDLLNELGTPSQMLTSANLSEKADVGSAELLMIYEDRVVFRLSKTVPIVMSNGETRAIFCLGNSKVEAGTFLLAKLYLVGHTSSPFSQFEEFVMEDIDTMTKNRYLAPFEDIFGITPEDVTQIALTGGDNCIFSKDLFGR